MTTVVAIIGALLLLVCILDWRVGMLICIVVGFVQDPIRKLIPQEPLFMVVAVGIFVLATLVGMWRKSGILLFEPVTRWYPPLRAPLAGLLVLLAVQYCVTLIAHGSVVVASIGMMSYVAPFVAVALTYYFTRGVDDIDHLMSFYVGGTLLVTGGVLLSFYGVDWSILEQVGAGLLIHDLDTTLEPHSGFMRSPEVAAWHMGAGACFIVILVNCRRSWKNAVVGGVLVAVFVAVILMTGRRKMIMQVLQFLVLYGALLLYFRSTISARLLGFLVLAMLVVWASVEVVFPGGYGSQFELYFKRGTTVFASAWERFTALGLGPVGWAIARVGYLGGGLGIGSQGAARFVELRGIAGGAGEGGLGKIILELGVPGLIMMGWLVVALAGYVLRILRVAAGQGEQALRLLAGLTAFGLANIPTFMVASQVYGDLYVLLVLGWVLGLILAVPKLVSRTVPLVSSQQPEPAAYPWRAAFAYQSAQSSNGVVELGFSRPFRPGTEESTAFGGQPTRGDDSGAGDDELPETSRRTADSERGAEDEESTSASDPQEHMVSRELDVAEASVARTVMPPEHEVESEPPAPVSKAGVAPAGEAEAVRSEPVVSQEPEPSKASVSRAAGPPMGIVDWDRLKRVISHVPEPRDTPVSPAAERSESETDAARPALEKPHVPEPIEAPVTGVPESPAREVDVDWLAHEEPHQAEPVEAPMTAAVQPSEREIDVARPARDEPHVPEPIEAPVTGVLESPAREVDVDWLAHEEPHQAEPVEAPMTAAVQPSEREIDVARPARDEPPDSEVVEAPVTGAVESPEREIDVAREEPRVPEVVETPASRVVEPQPREPDGYPSEASIPADREEIRQLRQEVQELRAEIQELRKDREILKQAMGILARDSR